MKSGRPVTPGLLAWRAEKGTLLPPNPYGRAAQPWLPDAGFTILPNVGHVAMMDDSAGVGCDRTTAEPVSV